MEIVCEVYQACDHWTGLRGSQRLDVGAAVASSLPGSSLTRWTPQWQIWSRHSWEVWFLSSCQWHPWTCCSAAMPRFLRHHSLLFVSYRRRLFRTNLLRTSSLQNPSWFTYLLHPLRVESVRHWLVCWCLELICIALILCQQVVGLFRAQMRIPRHVQISR